MINYSESFSRIFSFIRTMYVVLCIGRIRAARSRVKLFKPRPLSLKTRAANGRSSILATKCNRRVVGDLFSAIARPPIRTCRSRSERMSIAIVRAISCPMKQEMIGRSGVRVFNACREFRSISVVRQTGEKKDVTRRNYRADGKPHNTSPANCNVRTFSASCAGI